MLTYSLITSRNNTDSLKGLSAIGIVIFHIIINLKISPIFNVFGGIFVAVFLILSGYGINESFKVNGIKKYWYKKIRKILIPFVIFGCLYCLFCPDYNFQDFLDDILYFKPTYWFVFHIFKCYLVFWIAKRFCGKYDMLFMILCALCCLIFDHNTSHTHLEAEQSFSFICGVWLSRNKERFSSIKSKHIILFGIYAFIIGFVFYILKLHPSIQNLKDEPIFCLFLMPMRLFFGISMIIFVSLCKFFNNLIFKWLGIYSLEIYIVHQPTMQYIHDSRTTIYFILLTALFVTLFVGYRYFIEKKLLKLT